MARRRGGGGGESEITDCHVQELTNGVVVDGSTVRKADGSQNVHGLLASVPENKVKSEAPMHSYLVDDTQSSSRGKFGPTDGLGQPLQVSCKTIQGQKNCVLPFLPHNNIAPFPSLCCTRAFLYISFSKAPIRLAFNNRSQSRINVVIKLL